MVDSVACRSRDGRPATRYPRRSGTDRVTCLVGQPVVGVGGQAVEDVIELRERLPRFDTARCSQVGGDEVFQVGYPFGFPDLVGKADQMVIDRGVRVGPAGVGPGETGQPYRYAVGDEKAVADGFVLVSRA